MIPLFVCSAAFWSLYQQQFTVVTIYSDERLDRDLFGWEMPISWVQSINPVFIIVLAGVFAALWTRLGDRAPSTPVKFGAGHDPDGDRVPPVPADALGQAHRPAARVWR